jgi:hypothetical protein
MLPLISNRIARLTAVGFAAIEHHEIRRLQPLHEPPAAVAHGGRDGDEVDT